MKFLIINTDYPDFLQWLYTRYSGLEKQSYEEQMRARNESLFGVADFYSTNLHKLGHEAWDIHANNEWMQKTWAREQGIEVEESRPGAGITAKTPLRYIRSLISPKVGIIDNEQNWFYDILAAQIRQYKPDILLNLNMGRISPGFLQEIKPYAKLLVGEHGSLLSEKLDLRCYDLITSLLPNFVMQFRRLGIPSELHKLAFEPRILSYLNDQKKGVNISFVGNLFDVHSDRIQLLEVLSDRCKAIQVWGPGVGHLPRTSCIRERYVGQAWGLKMYQVLHSSAITINSHGDKIDYAVNMRLYEATGVGTLLITDWKENLHETFEPGREVIPYHTPEECVELIQYYLEHDNEREAIANAGQRRTLREHTYYQRMQELAENCTKILMEK